MAKKPVKKEDPKTTGHSWDGIEEFNNPLPRWWLWTLYLTIIWGIAYVIAYPAWPLINGATPGLLGYSSRIEVKNDIEAANAALEGLNTRIVEADLTAIESDEELLNYAKRGGAAIFFTNCAQCHGEGGAGADGFPNLNDDDWLWGGSIEDIHLTISHGIRDETDYDGRVGDMLAFGDDQMLEPEQIDILAAYVPSLSGAEVDPAIAEEGQALFLDNCAACHTDDGSGDVFVGSADLADHIWLYGDGDEETIRQTITHGRKGLMPSWTGKLTEAQIRMVAVYVHTLGAE